MVLEVFITIIKSITKAREHASVTEEIETRRESTFKVAVAFEEFALNYSKLHLTGGIEIHLQINRVLSLFVSLHSLYD